MSTAEIEALEWWEAEQQFRYWRRHPIVSDILCAVHGFKPVPREMNEAEEAAAIARFKAQKSPPGCLSFDELEAFASKHQAMQRKAG